MRFNDDVLERQSVHVDVQMISNMTLVSIKHYDNCLLSIDTNRKTNGLDQGFLSNDVSRKLMTVGNKSCNRIHSGCNVHAVC